MTEWRVEREREKWNQVAHVDGQSNGGQDDFGSAVLKSDEK